MSATKREEAKSRTSARDALVSLVRLLARHAAAEALSAQGIGVDRDAGEEGTNEQEA